MKTAQDTFGLDIEKIRGHFPMLGRYAHNKPLVYLDSAATTHKPQVVLDRLRDYYAKEYAKPEEVHYFSRRTTEAKEDTRKKMARFLGASSEKEIVFTKGCTEGLNIVANGLAQAGLEAGDEIILSQLEHHANIVPWLMAGQLTGAVIRVAPLTPAGELDLDALESLIGPRTRVISVAHSSHVLGSILPIRAIAALARPRDIAFVVDGAQAAPHMPVDLRELGCDFYTISCHKMGSPTGVGVLYGRSEWLDRIAPLTGGGDMAGTVGFDACTYAAAPQKFEGGTQSFADIIATSALIDFLEEIGRHKTAQYEQALLAYATQQLEKVDRVLVHGNAREKEPLVSFELPGLDVKKLERYLDREGIAIRAGDLTAQPLLQHLGVKALARLSFAFYNTYAEVDQAVNAIEAFIREEG